MGNLWPWLKEVGATLTYKDMLIDLADAVCRTSFGLDTLGSSVQTAYAEAGDPFRYLGERETRPK